MQWTQWQNVTRLNEIDWKQQTISDQIRPDWGIWPRPGYMDQATYEPDQSTQTWAYGPDQSTQTRVYGPDHIWTRADKTRPKYTDQGIWTRPDHNIQTKPDQTRLKYTNQNKSRPKYIHQIRLYSRLLNLSQLEKQSTYCWNIHS